MSSIPRVLGVGTLALVLLVSMVPGPVSADHDGTEGPHENTWNGHVACSTGSSLIGAYTSIPCSRVDDNQDVVDIDQDTQHEFTIERPEGSEGFLKTIVVGVEWNASPLSIGDRLMIVFSAADAGLGEAIADPSGTSPIEFRVDAHEIGANLEGENWPSQAAFRVFADGEPANVMIDQSFDVHYDLFYNDPAPEGYSALD